MVKSQVILGIVFIVIALFLFLIPVVGWIYGPVVILIGLALIIFRKEESKIEKIKGGKK